jgi:hypothetical protein
VALHNAGINADDQSRAARKAAAAGEIKRAQEPAAIEADEDKIVYKVTFDLPNAGHIPHDANLHIPHGDNRNDVYVVPAVPNKEPIPNHCYPTQACRSAVGNQPYNAYAPGVAFLQLGMTQAHRSVLNASHLTQMTMEVQLESHLNGRCNWNCTTKEVQSESHLNGRCNWNRTLVATKEE